MATKNGMQWVLDVGRDHKLYGPFSTPNEAAQYYKKCWTSAFSTPFCIRPVTREP